MPESGPYPESQDEGPESDFKPLTAAQAAQWRARQPTQSMWGVVRWQLAIGLACAVFAWVLGGFVFAQSAAYGALAVIAPAAMFVRGVHGGGVANAGSVWIRFCVWELAKVVLTVAMLVLAPRVLMSISWLALVFGMVVTMKAYWVAVWLSSKRRSS